VSFVFYSSFICSFGGWLSSELETLGVSLSVDATSVFPKTSSSILTPSIESFVVLSVSFCSSPLLSSSPYFLSSLFC